MTAAWSVHPIRPASSRHPAPAVCVHADDSAARDAIVQLAGILTASDLDALQEAAQRLDDAATEAAANEALADIDTILDQACARYGSDLSGLWHVRVGAKEAGDFCGAIVGALTDTRRDVPA